MPSAYEYMLHIYTYLYVCFYGLCFFGTTTPPLRVRLLHSRVAQEGIIIAFDSMAGRYHVRLADNGVRRAGADHCVRCGAIWVRSTPIFHINTYLGGGFMCF